jgi:hypothetical protein
MSHERGKERHEKRRVRSEIESLPTLINNRSNLKTDHDHNFATPRLRIRACGSEYSFGFSEISPDRSMITASRSPEFARITDQNISEQS